MVMAFHLMVLVLVMVLVPDPILGSSGHTALLIYNGPVTRFSSCSCALCWLWP